MLEVSTAMRKVARILWSIHAMFQEVCKFGCTQAEPPTKGFPFLIDSHPIVYEALSHETQRASGSSPFGLHSGSDPIRAIAPAVTWTLASQGTQSGLEYVCTSDHMYHDSADRKNLVSSCWTCKFSTSAFNADIIDSTARGTQCPPGLQMVHMLPGTARHGAMAAAGVRR